MMIFPGIFLVLTTLAFNLLGDGLRDALDPANRTLNVRTVKSRRLTSKRCVQKDQGHPRPQPRRSDP